jgi:hypothetical protein
MINKYILLIDSGFNKKGSIVEIEIIKQDKTIIEFRYVNHNGLLSSNYFFGYDMFNKKFRIITN